MQLFVKEKTDDYESLKQNGDSKKCTSEEADKMMADCAFANNTEKLLLDQEMEQYGIYIFSNYSAQNNTRYVDNGDVIVNTPYTYYSASSNRWTVACSGYWLNNS